MKSLATKSVEFEWSEPESNYDSYDCVLDVGDSSVVRTVTDESITFADDDDDLSLTPGETYTFHLFAVIDGVRGEVSNTDVTLGKNIY